MRTKHIKAAMIILILLIVCAIYLIDYSKTKRSESVVDEKGSTRVLFCPEQNCTEQLIILLQNGSSAHCALYEVTEPQVIELIRQRGEELVVNAQTYHGLGTKAVAEGIMHDKFCIFDGRIVLTGSKNPTTGSRNDDNNLLIIESRTIAGNYEQEYQELKGGLPDSPTESKKVNLSGTMIEDYFCPEDGCQQKILYELSMAKSSILFLTFTFTDKDIAGMLVAKQRDGINVSGIIESYQSQQLWVYPILQAGMVNVILDREKTLQHNKVFIIDNQTVITGSFNPTKSADTINDENIVVIKDSLIASQYTDYFNRLYLKKLT